MLETYQNDELQKYAATYVVPKLQAQLRQNKMFDEANDIQELMSETWNSYCYLASNFDESRGVPLLKYIGKYAYPLTLKNIVQAKKRASRFTTLEEVECMADKAMTPRQALEAKDKQLHFDQRIKDILDSMTPRDFQIAKEYMNGMTFDEIAKEHNMTQIAVRRIFRKYAK